MAALALRGAILGSLIVSLACGAERPASDVASADATVGGTTIIAFNAEMGRFNPLVNTDQNTNEVIYYMLFTPLVQYDESLEPRPYLAESWELEPDAVTFQLNRDVRWHDGEPVTAHDVEFTFRRAKDPQTASVLSSAYLGLIESAEVIDSFTIRFSFARPHARPLDGFWWAPVPKHLLEDTPPAEMVRAPFNRRPVGSGPFRFVDWEAGERLTLERVPGFPESLGGPPFLERVIFRFVGEPATLLSEALTGGIDVNGSLFPHQAEQVERTPGVRLLSYPFREYYYLGWNVRRPQLRDPSVRRALTMALDRGRLIDVLMYGYGQLATGTIAPWHPMFTSIEPLPFDQAAARDSLAAAGWIDRDGDGVRESEAGTPLRFTLMTNYENPVRVDIAQLAQARLARIGVDVEVQTLEWQTLLARHRGREFDAVVQSWVLDNFRVDPAALFHSSQADRPGSYNRSGLEDPEVDRLIEMATSASDPEVARRLWSEFSLALQQAQPFTFLVWLDELASVSDRIRGVEMDARGTLVTIAEWWIPPQRRQYVSERGN
ncbi:MAG: ABC transporter substrate-binding protein [Gemmatimonadales bacterium]|jgi:peptide/nickel transport system substrate-binding protein